MMRKMKRRQNKWRGRCARWAVVAMLASCPATAMAADEEDIVDARLEGYPANVTLPGGGSGMTWVLFIILSAVALGGLFKDAKRTHLD